MTPDELRQMADDFDREAAQALRAGKGDEANRLFAAAEAARERAEEREAKARRLRPGVNKRTVNTVLSPDHRVAISAGRGPKNKLAAAARSAGMSMRDLAKKVGVSIALLSMASTGKRAIPRDAAAKIERLTGYPTSSWRSLS